MRLSVERRMQLGFSLVVLLTLFLIGASLQVSGRQKELNHWVTHSHQAQTQIQHVLALVTKAKAGERGFILTGDLRFIDSRTDDFSDIEPELSSLSALVANSFPQRTNLARLRLRVGESMSVVEQVIRLRKRGKVEAAHKMAASHQARTDMERLEQAIGAMEQEENFLLKQRTEAVETYDQDAKKLFASLLPMIFSSLALVYFGVRATHRKLEQQMLLASAQARELEAQKAALEDANRQLTALSITDGLTGLYNRRAFQKKAEEEFKRAQRYHLPMSIILLDIDKFKAFNDSFGHPEGDHVLKMVAQTLREVARGTDYVCRYGGEEFVIILPNTEAMGAKGAAERFRAAIEAQLWAFRPVTASFGVSTFHTDSIHAFPMTVQKLIVQADKALYASKEQGRNRGTHFAEIPPQEGLEKPGASIALAYEGTPQPLPQMPLEALTLLQKPGTLTEEEWEIMRPYTALAYRREETVSQQSADSALPGRGDALQQ